MIVLLARGFPKEKTFFEPTAFFFPYEQAAVERFYFPPFRRKRGRMGHGSFFGTGCSFQP
jgi:hypothetical protein